MRFPIPSLTRVPQPQPSDADELDVVSATLDDVAELAAIEHAVVGYPRLADYPWLIEHREAYMYRRDSRAVGFAFVSQSGQGPIAALEPADQIAILLNA